MPKILTFAKIMPIFFGFATIMPKILTFIRLMPKFFTYRPIMLKEFSFAIIMPIFKFSPKYYYRFNQNDVMNMLSKNV